MKVIDITITNDTGIHTRPGNELVKLVKSFEKSVIQLEKGEKKILANSLLQIMSLAVKKGDVIKVYIDGGDEEAVAEKCLQFFADLKE